MYLEDKDQDIFEMCECGHVGGSTPTIYNMHEQQYYNGQVIAKGHGECINVDCNCIQFTWVKFCDKDGNELDDSIIKGEIHKKEVERQMELLRINRRKHKTTEVRVGKAKRRR